MRQNIIRLNRTAISTDMFADLHAHVLPNIDDGPETIEQSIELLKAAADNGIDRIVATPHFYGSVHGLDEHVAKAANSFEALKKEIICREISIKDILLGYEVRYFSGISKSEDISRICLNGSNILLLELGSIVINDRVINDILELEYSGYTVILAHLERYTKLNGFKHLKPIINGNTVLAQITADAFTEKGFQRAAYRLLKEGLASVLATDMHHIDYRPPKFAEAIDIISCQMGAGIAKALVDNGNQLFEKISHR